jgi:N-acetylmuramoyl-L-alanine amidase
MKDMDNSLPEEPLSVNPETPGDADMPENLEDPENVEFPEAEASNEPESSSKKNKPEYTVLNGVQTVVSIALVMATLLTLWNPRKVFNTPSLASLVEAEATKVAAEAEASKNPAERIGILSGHWEDSNPGEVCADGLIESDVNHDIATRVAEKLEDLGYSVDQFPEYDLSLLNYEGAAFIAIYSGSCAEDPLPASGFRIGGSYSAQNPNQIDRLATCLSEKYQNATGLPFAYSVINAEDASYHIFRDVSANTPAVRLELGSLKTDRRIIVDQADKAADGIVAGILCFLNEQGENSK